MPMLFNGLKINGVSLLVLPAGLANLAKSRRQTPLEQQRRQNVVVIVVMDRLACVVSMNELRKSSVEVLAQELEPFFWVVEQRAVLEVLPQKVVQP